MSERVVRYIIFQVKKMFYKTRYGTRICVGSGGKANFSNSIRIIGTNAFIRLGKGMNFRPNSEVFAFENGEINIGDYVFINRGVIIGAADSITIGNGVTIGPNTCIYDHNHSSKNDGTFEAAPIVIDERVWIGANVSILKGVHIGKNSVVGAGSVVTHDIPADSIYYDKRERITIARK